MGLSSFNRMREMEAKGAKQEKQAAEVPKEEPKAEKPKRAKQEG